MKTEKQESPLPNLLFNIVIPVFILNKLTESFDLGPNGPLIALILALIFPVGYGLWDYLGTKRKNFISIFGILNILLTGGFALFRFPPESFAIKEAAIPFIIGCIVLGSALIGKPLLFLLLGQNQLFDTDRIDQCLLEKGTQKKYVSHLKLSTVMFSISFFLSALLNYILARSIFVGIDPLLPEAARSEILNQQISQMTWKGYVVIALPLMIFTFLIVWYTVRGIKQMTGLSFEEVLNIPGRQNSSDKTDLN